MKPFKIIISLFLVALFFISCEQEEEAVPASNSLLILGDWTVSSFIKGNKDLTGEFTAYTFYCTENGGMIIKGNGRNYNCNWSNMNNSDSIFYFRIMGCGPNSVLLECMDEWDLVTYDSLHCYFTSHNADHHRAMSWNRTN